MSGTSILGEMIVIHQNPVTVSLICWRILYRIIIITLCSIQCSQSFQKIKRTGYGKRRKKKVKKSLYGEREMASKKPLLSPILEIPEVFSSTSSPNSPKANAFFSGNGVFSFVLPRSFCCF